MCGLAGILGRADADADRSEVVKRMAATLEHRGPDADGFDAIRHLDLGFRRLAIVDLSAPSPPYANEDRSVWSVCNGEIYNGDELRADLESRGHVFHTHVDTEVIPHLWEEHGADLVHHLNGMFALVVWDVRTETLLIARDRAGEKPMFFWEGPDRLVFASEMRAMLADPEVPRELDLVSLRRYLTHGYYPSPHSPIQGVRKLGAGELIEVKNDRVEVRRYWDLADHYTGGKNRPTRTADAIDELDRRLELAVNRRRRSDVPVGLFLSSGLDSSTVLAYLAEQVGPGVPVFSLGHADKSFDETGMAERTARYFGAEYHELVLDESGLAEGLRRVAEGFDEPLADASTIPTHMLSRFAREHVKVVLSGEGADELFAGYPTYIGSGVADRFARLPGWLQRAISATARKLTPKSGSNVGLDYLVEKFTEAASMDRVSRHTIWFGAMSPSLQATVLSPGVQDVLAGDDPMASSRAVLAGRTLPDSLSELLYMDFRLYLAEDLLTKVDRSTMLTSLEARAPFLDHELAEFVAGLPSRMKLDGFKTKAILRKTAARRLPKEVLGRRKRGFNIPFSRWLHHGLGTEMQRRFSEERVATRGLFDFVGVQTLIDDHLAHRADYRKPLFALLAFDLWCDKVYGDGGPIPHAGAPR